ncbi:MAG TPA: GNAT family N-acetyltransferase [Marmoricola sp.]|nr:GNAT family N-acetyltransferase [Marmoricola sp.]
MRVEEYDANDADAVEASRLVLNACNPVDTPWAPPPTAFRREMDVRHGWDHTPHRYLLGLVDDEPVACADVELPQWDNRDLAWIYLNVRPERRRRGYGSELMRHVLDLVASMGRPKAGTNGFEGHGTAEFAAAHGFGPASVEVCRVLSPKAVPPGFYDELGASVLPAAADYELVRWTGRTPPGLLPAVTEMTAAINDAPYDDLDLEHDVYTPGRIVAYESAVIDGGNRLYRLLAQHRRTGELVGHTVVAVDIEDPRIAHQHDTSVVRAHRGHRLGLLLKAEMMRWLAEAEPEIDYLDTWNAESNEHMVAVNERLGFRAVGRELAFQRRLD